MANLLNNGIILALVGLVLSAYSVYVEHRVEHKDDEPDGEEYSAMCDIEVRRAFASIRAMAHECSNEAPPLTTYIYLYSLCSTGDWCQLQVSGYIRLN